jgi:hypothetical protein
LSKVERQDDWLLRHLPTTVATTIVFGQLFASFVPLQLSLLFLSAPALLLGSVACYSVCIDQLLQQWKTSSLLLLPLYRLPSTHPVNNFPHMLHNDFLGALLLVQTEVRASQREP